MAPLRMTSLIFQRYIGRSILQATFFVLCAFLSMFLFFDFMAELEDIGPFYQVWHAVGYVLLGIPGRSVELAPIAALIGTLWALSQSAANSEFTVFRVSGLRPMTMVRSLLAIGLPMVLVTAVFSEVVTPFSEGLRSDFREMTRGSGTGALRSGLWLRDSANQGDAESGGSRFVNVASVNADRVLQKVTVYEFDGAQRLLLAIEAETAAHVKGSNESNEWELRSATLKKFGVDGSVRMEKINQMRMVSVISPEMLDALLTKPDRMTFLDLYRYVQYLKQNKQTSERFEIALWKRITYPFAIWVMMALALPVAFLQARAGAVGARVFAGILVGIGFHLINSLFSHLGVLTTWPPSVMAILPSLFALTVAATFFYWVQRR